MLTPVLVVLTVAAGGPPHLSLAPVEDPAECPARAEAIGRVLAEAGTEVIAVHCAATSVPVTPYVHGARPEDFVHRWRVETGPQGVRLSPLAGAEGCDPGAGVICAVSAQAAAPD